MRLEAVTSALLIDAPSALSQATFFIARDPPEFVRDRGQLLWHGVKIGVAVELYPFRRPCSHAQCRLQRSQRTDRGPSISEPPTGTIALGDARHLAEGV